MFFLFSRVILLNYNMLSINNIITSAVGYLPKWLAKPFANPYVAGENQEDVLKKVKVLNESGMCATIDMLGEHTKDQDEAKSVTNQYCEIFQKISGLNLDCNISVKPTHVGLDISYELARDNFLKLTNTAKKFSNFLRIDMESSKVTNHTIKVYKECKSVYDKVGLVLQAYLKRSVDDLKLLSKQSFNSRICKGIYNESSQISFNSRISINENYIKMAKLMHQSGSYAAYATHDQDLIDQLISWIKANKISKSSFEFQVLYGVPMQGRLEQLINQGYKVRIYVPYGKDWFDYSVRRLKENPNIIKYVLKNFLKSN